MQRNAKTHLTKLDGAELQQRWRAIKSSWNLEVANLILNQDEDTTEALSFAKILSGVHGTVRITLQVAGPLVAVEYAG